MTRQQRVILRLLKENPEKGINSFILRRSYNIIQAPVRIRELKQLGYNITTTRNPDKSVNYILTFKYPRTNYIYKGNTAYPVSIVPGHEGKTYNALPSWSGGVTRYDVKSVQIRLLNP